MVTKCIATRNHLNHVLGSQLPSNQEPNYQKSWSKLESFWIVYPLRISDKFNFCYWIVNSNTFQLVRQLHLTLYKPLNSFCSLWFSLSLAGESDLSDKIVLIFGILVQLWTRKNILSITVRNWSCFFLCFYGSYIIIKIMT